MISCFYHGDNDGKCSAAIVCKKFGSKNVYCQSVVYGTSINFDKIEKEQEVYVVDFSFEKKEEWDILFSKTQNVTWIDHHNSAIIKKDNPHHLPGIRKNGVAAAQLTWDFMLPNEPTPKVVKLVSDWDIWRFKYGDLTKQFNSGLYSYRSKPYSEVWEILLDMDHIEYETLMYQIIHNGTIITDYDYQKFKGLMCSQKYYIEFEGYRTCVINNRGTSIMFDSVDSLSYDICMWWYYNGKYFTITLSTERDNIDISQIAMKYGGGGHKKIGGFNCSKLPDWLII